MVKCYAQFYTWLSNQKEQKPLNNLMSGNSIYHDCLGILLQLLSTLMFYLLVWIATKI